MYGGSGGALLSDLGRLAGVFDVFEVFEDERAEEDRLADAPLVQQRLEAALLLPGQPCADQLKLTLFDW